MKNQPSGNDRESASESKKTSSEPGLAGQTLPKERRDLQVAINLTTPFLLAQAVGPGMLSRGYGRVLNISSQTGVIAPHGHAGYSSTKAGLIGLTKVLALEWGPHSVTVNAVSPTVVNSALGRRVFDGEEGTRFKSLLPTRRFAELEEI
ncbi:MULTISPECIES: SDR family NAD(P)-dependent oxidoreductase [Enterobacteriaceae]|nr:MULTISPECIES: SDR family NAD(P)-dependent oxidoreductase [Enterobacteriaceae]